MAVEVVHRARARRQRAEPCSNPASILTAKTYYNSLQAFMPLEAQPMTASASSMAHPGAGTVAVSGALRILPGFLVAPVSPAFLF